MGTTVVTTIIGNGLLAKRFAAVEFKRDCLVLASGVSNSNEQRPAEFQREVDIVEAAIRAHASSRVIYFSTCSVLQTTQTPYVRHKLAMESLVAALASSFCIYRLPQVVGPTRNQTLVSYFVEAVLLRRRVTVQRWARRNLVDVDDVVRLISHLIQHDIGTNSTQALAAAHGVSVAQVLKAIGGILDLEPLCDVIDAGDAYDIPTDFLERHFGASDPLMQFDYWRTALQRHVPALASTLRCSV